MAFPNVYDTLGLLGHRAKDRITGATGVITTVAFDLFGCVQAGLNPGLDKDGKPGESHWYDIQRFELLDEPRVMEPPPFGDVYAANYDTGPEHKPPPRAG